MNKPNKSVASPKNKKKSKIRTLLFILQVVLVLVLLIGWVSFKTLRTSKNLWVLFFYSFPSEFLIAVDPHEPILLYFGKYYSPLTVAVVGIVGTIMTEAINYSVFKYITDTNLFQKIRHKKAVNKIIDLFQRSPFLAVWIAGLTPIPFYPFRFLVVLARYPVFKYLLAVFLSRTPRFCLLAYLGHTIKFPDYLLIILFVILILAMNIQFLFNVLKKKAREGKPTDS